MLNQKQFDTLVLTAESNAKLTQREIAGALDYSVGAANKIVNELSEMGLLCQQVVTDNGFSVLENYRVKRAVFIAAGFGARLVPVTLNTPKPLVRIKGQRLIDTMLDAVTAAGISEIYIVRGYLSEQFDQLLYKYPSIQFLENPAYNESNNISSAVCACGHLSSAYVLDADLYLKNPKLVTKYQYASNYLGAPVERTDDWCLLVKNGRIDGISLGGVHCHTWVGISYWTQQDGMRLANDIKQIYQTPGGKEKFWDQVPLECCKEHYYVGIRECTADDVVEIDTFRELKALDRTYDV